MNKRKKLLFLLFLMVVILVYSANRLVASTAKADNSSDELYKEVIITSLSPTIDIALRNYYSHVLKEIPSYDFSAINLIDINRPNGNGTEKFIIELEIEPYLGPHIAVGKDQIIIKLERSESPQITSFHHLKDYELPDRYKELYVN